MNTAGLTLAAQDSPLLLRGSDLLRWTAVVAFLALGIGLRSPWPADEPRFALAAMDMVANNHWWLPHRGGEIYADKPPVFMWLQALFFLLTGNMRTAFLLPSLFAATATLWMVHDLTRRLFGSEQAWFAVLALLTTVQFTLQAKSGQIDATLMGFTTLGLYGLLRHHCIEPSLRWYRIAWLAMGVGVITKGVGILPVFLLPGLWLVRRRRGENPLPQADWRTWLSPVLILLPAIVWLLPLLIAAVAGQHPEIQAYLREILFRQTLTRYSQGLGHDNPPWYYLVNVVPLLWLPLSALLPWLIPDWVRRLRENSHAHWALLSFVVLALIFFSISPGKRGVYMLPLLPAMAILAGTSFPRLVHASGPMIALRVVALVAGSLLIGTAAAVTFSSGSLSGYLSRSGLPIMPTMLLLFSAGSVWLLCATLRRRGAFTVGIVMTWLLVSTWGYALLDPIRSADALMADVATHLAPDDRLAILEFREQLLLQADRPVVHWSRRYPAIEQVADAMDWVRENPKHFLLLPEHLLRVCIDQDVGVRLGYRHRSDWRLVSASDVARAVRCPMAHHETARYIAPYLAYPYGR